MKKVARRTATPFLSMLLLAAVLLGGPLTLIILFTVWQDSVQRQIAGILGLLILAGFLMFRRKYEILLLALVVVSQVSISLVSISLAEPAKFQVFILDVLLLLFFVAAVERKERLRPDTIGWLFIALVAWQVIAIFFSGHPSKSFVFVFWQLKLLLLYLFVRNLELSEKLARQLSIAALVVIGCQALLAIAQQVSGGPLGLVVFGEQDPTRLFFVKGDLRVSGTLGATNGLAGYLAMLLTFCLPFLFRLRSVVWYGAYSIGFIALLFTYSRAGWLSFSLGAGFVVLALLRAGIIRRTRIVAIGILGAVVVGIGIGIYFDQIQERFQDERAIRSAQGRFTQFALYWPIIEQYSITGIGPGVTEYYGAWNDNARYLSQTLPGVRLGNQPHSSQAQYWVESGTPAFLLFMAIFVLVLRGAFQKPVANPGMPEISLLRIGATSAAVAAMTHASFGTEINNYQISAVFWIALAISRNQMFDVVMLGSYRKRSDLTASWREVLAAPTNPVNTMR